jgi:choline dehydrogenase-like flavoprotein
MTVEQAYDYVVIGAGASGCVVANRLSARPETTVLLLEAGLPDTAPSIHDVGGFVQLWGSEADWKLSTTPQPGLNGREILINQGKVLGGSTSINALMWVRGNRRDFDGWHKAGADGWSYRDLLPYFRRVEDYEGGASDYRGVGGPLSVRVNPDSASRSEAFAAAAMEMGFDGPSWDYNGPRQENGAGPLQFTIARDGRRASAATAYIDPVRERPNLVVMTGAEATRLLFEGTRLVGVEYVRAGVAQQVRVVREAIVSAGAFLSPKLLMLSGLGPANDLRGLGIRPVADLPGVGRNLQDHLQLPVVYRTPVERPMPTLLTGNTLFVRTRQGQGDTSPDLQLNFTPSVPAPLAPVLNIGVPVCIFLPILIQPESVGSVSLRSANPQDPPLIDPRYLDRDADTSVLVQAVRLIRELASAKAFADLNAGELAPGPSQDLVDFARAQSSTLWHPVGTCRMGRDADAVVDEHLRVRGVERLRVADASVMPKVTAGNTQAACFMIGERAADLVLGVQSWATDERADRAA